ncbi:MAG: SusC/RagA family TonB-linked outer membrane protein [Chitinophagaceae bacterium]|nr:SusC/RagA family TonB-linked outer membrane protein [Chitinophagaceae bacterium]
MYRLPKLFLFTLSLCYLMLSALNTLAQGTITVKGQVVDEEEGKPLSLVTIEQVKGTATTLTNDNGMFEINVPAGSRLRFSSVGYNPITVTASDKASMTIRMEINPTSMQEVVVLGYGTAKRELLSASVATMKISESDRQVPTTQMGNLLAGKLAGVSVSTSNGVPGVNQPGIKIRTNNSWNAQPVLYVIDGKIMGAGDFNNLSPNDIESITVLKDAASAAVYGSRAAGGVILVTTKRGQSGKMQIQLSVNTGVDKRAKNVKLTSAIQQGELFDQVFPGGLYGMEYTQEDYDYMKTINNGYGFNQLDAVWVDPSTTTYNLNASGGNEKIKYFVGGSYVKQNGFYRTLKYDKYNIRANITANITKNLQVFSGLTLNRNITKSNSWFGTSQEDMYSKLLVWQPWMPAFTNGGKPFSYGWIGNFAAQANGQAGGYDNLYTVKPVINLSATYKAPFLKGLSATAAYSKSFMNNINKVFATQYLTYITKQESAHIWSLDDADIIGTQLSSQVNPSYMQDNVTWSEDRQLDLQLNYERTFGDNHHVKGWLIYEGFLASGSGVSAGIQGFPVYTTNQWWAASPRTNNNQFVSNSTGYSDYETGRKSWVGQFFYDFKEKYIANIAYRYDGSMNFAPDKRWGFFPSGSLGWIVSKENFFKAKGIQLLKLRASMGLVGNDAVGGWQWQTSYAQGNSYYFGTPASTNIGIRYGSVVNPALTWEKSLNKDFGVDISFLDHFTASADYWYTHTYDILGSRIQTTPPTFSLSLPAVNYGIMNAQGFELSVGYNNQFGPVNFNTQLIASYGYAKWVLRDINATYDYQNYNGRTTTYIAGYQLGGMLRTQADLDQLIAKTPDYKFNGNAPALGQFYYADLNSSNALGVPDGIVDQYDITVLRKNNDPVVVGWNFGLEWKGIALNASFNGMFRQWKWIGDLNNNVEWNRMWDKWATDSWTPTRTDAFLPIRYSAAAGDGRAGISTAGSNFWYKNASFLRLKNLVIGYTIPTKLYQRLNIGQIQVYGSGANLFIISKFNKLYYDPEMGGGTVFPILKSYNLGINVTF